MNNGLLYFGGLLVLVLAVLFAVPFFIDWNGYRGVFEEEASKVLGRDVRVGGGVNLRLLPTPYVRFEKVRLADTTGQTGEPFVRAESFTMWLSGPALLRGVLEANDVELARPVLSLVLDGEGGGNWTTLKLKPGALPFVPQNVALKSVKLLDGTIAFYGAQSQPIGKISSLNGELSAEALDGPFKFKGTGKWGADEREFKFATTAPGADGAFRFKGITRSQKTGASYTLDGEVRDFSGKPQFTGDLTARLAIPLANESAKGAPAAKEPAGIDMKARVTGNALGTKFEDVTISLESAAEPQLVTGTASASWSGEPRFDTALSAKWLDLDRLAGAGDGGATLPRIKQLGLGLMRTLAGNGAAGARIEIDQVQVAGEPAGGLIIDTDQQGGVLHIKDMKAGLPGGSRIDLSGEMKDDGQDGSFDGQLVLHGANIARLIGWAGRSGSPVDIKAEGAYSVEGRLTFTDKSLAFTEAKAELDGQVLTGELRINDEGRRRVSVIVEGSRLNTAVLFPDKAQEFENDIRAGLGLARLEAGDGAKHSGSAAADKAQSDMSLRILAAELRHGSRTFRNVDASVALEGGELRVPRAKFVSGSGLGVTFEARVKNAASEPKGSLSYEFDAKTPEAMKDAADMMGLAEILPVERLQALGTGRMAGLVRFGGRAKGTADVNFGGVLKGAHISGRAEIDGGLAAWRTAPARVTVDIKSPDLAPILTMFGTEARVSRDPARPATLTLALSGTPAAGAASLAELKGEGLSIAFAGKTIWPTSGQMALEGDFNVKARDLNEVVALMGLTPPGGLAATAVEGVITVARKDNVRTLSSERLMLGTSQVRGKATITREGTGNATISADVAANQIKVASLLSAVVERAGATVEIVDIAPADLKKQIWPEGSFNLDLFKGAEGSARVKFAVLELDNGLAARDGAMTITFKPGKVAISDLAAAAVDGKLEAEAELEKVPGAFAGTAKVKITDAKLQALSPRAAGTVRFELAATGRAQSPAALISQLSGKGSATLAGAVHPGPSPAQVAEASDLVLAGKLPNEPSAITEAIVTRLANAQATPGARQIALSIVDGAVRVDPYVIDGKAGKTTVTTTIDLTSMSLDSAWQIAAVAPMAQPPQGANAEWVPTLKGPLPSVAIIYVGRLADLGHLTARVEPGDLQRELTVRQMERNVEELERLRHKDEDRARREQDRRKALEADKAAAAARTQGASPPPAGEQMPPVVPQSNDNAAPHSPAGDGTGADGAVYDTQGGEQDPGQGAAQAPLVAPAAAAAPAVVPQPKPAAAARRVRLPAARTSADEMMRAMPGTP